MSFRETRGLVLEQCDDAVVRQAASSSPYAGITRIRFKRFPRRLSVSPAVSQPLDEAPLGTASMVEELPTACQERFLIKLSLRRRASASAPLALLAFASAYAAVTRCHVWGFRLNDF